jgi:hypothetical protein
MDLELASYEIKETNREHDEGDKSAVDVLRFIGGAKGKIQNSLVISHS